MMRRLTACACLAAMVAAGPVRACDTALILAVDVSNSIDSAEYAIQAEGMAEALLDPLVVESLVSGRVALMVIQWSGMGDQVISVPWRRIETAADVEAVAEEARAMRRAIIMSNTAVGALIRFARAQFADVPDCERRVIDISGDGDDNAGTSPEAERRIAEREGITINGLAIESIGLAVTNYYRLRVITRNGFVMTAQGHSTYAETLKEKIRREVARVMF